MYDRSPRGQGAVFSSQFNSQCATIIANNFIPRGILFPFLN